LAVGLAFDFLSDLFKGLCFVSLANYFNIAVGKQSVTRFPVFPGSFFLASVYFPTSKRVPLFCNECC